MFTGKQTHRGLNNFPNIIQPINSRITIGIQAVWLEEPPPYILLGFMHTLYSLIISDQ